MNENELRKLKRVDLLELLISQGRENEELRRRLEEAEQKLRDREIKTAEAGSIAEAALRLNGVFEAAQRAADQYLENVKKQSGYSIDSVSSEYEMPKYEAEKTEMQKIEEKIQQEEEEKAKAIQENKNRVNETGQSRWLKIKRKSSK